MIKVLLNLKQDDRSNPLAGLGTMLGFLTDPSGLLLFSPAAKVLVRSGKISNTAKIGSAAITTAKI